MVPIARILQESKEGVRLLTGLDRTDEALFNVLRFGKNRFRAWQNDRSVMIKPVDGSRVYEFHPWGKILPLCLLKTLRMCQIYDYLEELAAREENSRDYILYGNNTGGFVKKSLHRSEFLAQAKKRLFFTSPSSGIMYQKTKRP